MSFRIPLPEDEKELRCDLENIIIYARASYDTYGACMVLRDESKQVSVSAFPDRGEAGTSSTHNLSTKNSFIRYATLAAATQIEDTRRMFLKEALKIFKRVVRGQTKAASGSSGRNDADRPTIDSSIHLRKLYFLLKNAADSGDALLVPIKPDEAFVSLETSTEIPPDLRLKAFLHLGPPLPRISHKSIKVKQQLLRGGGCFAGWVDVMPASRDPDMRDLFCKAWANGPSARFVTWMRELRVMLMIRKACHIPQFSASAARLRVPPLLGCIQDEMGEVRGFVRKGIRGTHLEEIGDLNAIRLDTRLKWMAQILETVWKLHASDSAWVFPTARSVIIDQEREEVWIVGSDGSDFHTSANSPTAPSRQENLERLQQIWTILLGDAK